MKSPIFENLFVLELANNHWGNIDRGIQIIREFGSIVKHNNVKAAIKFQIRDVDNFIHKDYRDHASRYIQKTIATKMSFENYKRMADEVINIGCIPMATPFDEASVDMCVKLDFPLIKIASSDANDWPLIQKVASTKKPVIVSNGGLSEKDLDDFAKFFENRSIPLAINHCVSLYPSEDNELNLDQIDYLKARYPNNVIGFSSHEYHDWTNSMMISYAKGARTWERHIDIDYVGDDWSDKKISPYCTKPINANDWFQSYHKAIDMCGGVSDQKRVIPTKETKYLDELVRGIYAKNNIQSGTVINSENFSDLFYLAIPLLKGQLSCREIINGEKIIKDIDSEKPLTVEHVDGPYNSDENLKKMILERGFETS
tara:strand:+ start:30736 stop:31848 length:1113 start_codon:yes stop_codon:yes gene_type:complete